MHRQDMKTAVTLSVAALVLRARQEFDALVEALRRDLFDAEASEALLRWLVDLQPRASRAWAELARRPRGRERGDAEQPGLDKREVEPEG
jgi:hypothetical protein